MRYAVLGTGAIGGFYGGQLARSGCDVHFLLHSDYDIVNQRGLIVESVHGDFVLSAVNAYADVAKMPPCDVVLVALKSTQNHLLPTLLPAVVQPGGAVVLLQNGLGAEPDVAQVVNAVADGVHVIGGLCFICSNKVGPGHIRHLDYGNLDFGEYRTDYAPAGVTEWMRQIGADFQQAGLGVTLSEDLLQIRWQKLVWNIPFNGLSVVLDATTEEMIGNPVIYELAALLMQEVAMGAKSCDRPIPDHYIQTRLDHTEKMKPYHTSMKLDYDAGRPMELQTIFANPLAMARSRGVELPRIAMLYQQLQFLNPQPESHP